MARAARFLPVVLTVAISLACVSPVAPPSSPTQVGSPTIAQEAPEEVAISSAITDSTGRTVVAEPTGTELAIVVDITDADSEAPIAGVDVYLLKKGSRYLVVAVDPEGRYLARWSEGFTDELGAESSSRDALGSFVLPRAAHAQALPVVLILLKVVSTVSSLEDLAAYLQDPPDFEYWGVLYEERCWTSEQLANYLGAAGLVIPGGEMDDLVEAIYLMSQHVIEQDLKDYFRNLEQPMRIRTYHLGIPVLGMVPVGWCDGATSTPTSTPTFTSTPTPPPSPTPTAMPGLTRGHIAFSSIRDGNWEIYVMNADGSEVARLTDSPAADVRPSWSPDAAWIAFESTRDDNWEIYVMYAEGSAVTRLTNNPAWDTYPTWSPEGTLIAFVSERDGNEEVYVMDVDGTNQRNLTNNPANDFAPSWSPDGTRIAFASEREGVEVYIMNADGSGLTRLANRLGYDGVPSWSPDGTRIAFGSELDGNYEIFVLNVDGSGLTRLTNNPYTDCSPSWSPDGSRIAFDSYRNGQEDIYTINADGTGLMNLTNNPAWDADPSWSPE